MATLALGMIVLDEEQGLPLALASARSWADEVVIAVDRRTTDRTREVVADVAPEARLLELEFIDFAQMRNAVVAAIESDWVLMLDGDEVLQGDPRPLLAERPAIWEFPRRHWMDFERTVPAPDDRFFPDRQARLFPADGRVRLERPVHEVPEGLRKRRCRSVVIHHFKEPLRSEEQKRRRRACFLELVKRGQEEGHRFRKGKDY